MDEIEVVGSSGDLVGEASSGDLVREAEWLNGLNSENTNTEDVMENDLVVASGDLVRGAEGVDDLKQEIIKEPDDIDLEKSSAVPVLHTDEAFTDVGNAIRFMAHFKMLLFYCHTVKSWFYWSEMRWKLDSGKIVTRCAIKAIKWIRDVEHEKHDRKEELVEWLVKSLQNSKIKALLTLSADLMPRSGELDTHKDFLNTLSGTINLRTGALLKHDPKHWITKLAPVIYPPSADCKKWLGFMHFAFSGDQSIIDYVQKLIGYTLTGEISEKILIILWGPDGNEGKTLLNNVFRGILGSDYCINIASDSLTSGRQHVRSDIGRLDGKNRFATSSETDQALKFKEPLIKELTGDDVITARRLNANEREFRVHFKLILTTNHTPQLNLSDPAMADRVIVIPFLNPIPREKRIPNFAEILVREEGPGILRWAVEGAKRWYEEGLGTVPIDQKDLRKISMTPTVKGFIKERCNTAPNLTAKTHDLYEAYKKFHAEVGCEYEPISRTAFGSMLTSQGFDVVHKEDANYRSGLCLKPVQFNNDAPSDGSI